MRKLWPSILFSALYVSVAAYCLLSAVAGPAGIIAHRELAGKNAMMVENLERLRATNEELRMELNSLRSDPDRASLEARALGYLAPGETALVLSGNPAAQAPARRIPGMVMKAPRPRVLPDGLIKELAALAGLVYLGLALVPGLRSEGLRLRRPKGRASPLGQGFGL